MTTPNDTPTVEGLAKKTTTREGVFTAVQIAKFCRKEAARTSGFGSFLPKEALLQAAFELERMAAELGRLKSERSTDLQVIHSHRQSEALQTAMIKELEAELARLKAHKEELEKRG